MYRVGTPALPPTPYHLNKSQTPLSIKATGNTTITLHRHLGLFFSQANMLLSEFAIRLNEQHPNLAAHLTITDLVKFVNLASEVYDRADEALMLTSSDTRMLPFMRLALQLAIDEGDYESLWTLSFPSIPFAHINPANMIRLHGLNEDLKKNKVYEVYLTPPTHTCLVCDQSSGRQLRQRPRIDGYMYDLDGIHSAEFHTWACLDCNTYYRPSYYKTKNKQRVYYSKAQGADPHHFQVHCHFAMTHRLAMSFRQSQMLAHISNFNLVNLYNLTHFKDQQVPTHFGDQSSPKISQEVARDAVDVFSLLRRCEQRGYVLHVSAEGKDADRFLPAM
ncbi:uncharacterized protein MELLADRAFT_85929 [Melampsora larici-populina 98AG31]|uniref:CxC5 like cysteine cluster associated with KDZ domain-containing protein n=1 Tax=Melampsora larici-populina (strain 98AG31 / pathotype 3-4-7) TaxID=747676 RepID=F4RK66_MELLP|nr:uncharacterized protein MELLADRAFT_85929 [Melampsora larici-populina 98AG31]EGG07044.1 hypothetical protein MELLADRAFT_85929 [Melampsora larici-populina 98AG31]